VIFVSLGVFTCLAPSGIQGETVVVIFDDDDRNIEIRQIMKQMISR
jgi:hypothetical protein